MANVYLALYKAKGNWVDYVIRFFDQAKYSHCELAVEKAKFANGGRYPEIEYECYSSSPRDGGVRCKKIDVSDHLKWDLIPLPNISESEIKHFYSLTQGRRYDFFGAVGIVLPFRHSHSKYFCSEWIAEVLGLDNPHKYSPKGLFEYLKGK